MTTSSCRCSSTVAGTARSCDSSSTWTWAGQHSWSPEAVVSKREILAHLETHYGAIRPIGEPSSAPAERFSLPDGLTFGIIASTTEPFCASCDRARSDGGWCVVDVSLRVRGNRSPTAAACRRDERRTQAAGLDGVGDPAPTAGPKSGWRPNDA